MKGKSYLTIVFIMDQVFFRQPVKSNAIQFNSDSFSSTNALYNNFSGACINSNNDSYFSDGNSQVETTPLNTIPVYNSKYDYISIELD